MATLIFRLYWCLTATCLAMMTVASPARAQIGRAGFTSIISTKSGDCIDIAGMQTQPGAIAVQWPCQNSVNERYFVQTVQNGFEFIEQQSSLCLALVPGGQVALGACGSVAATWKIEATGRAYHVASVANGQCLTPTGDSLGAAAWLSTAVCSDHTLHTWTFGSGLVMPSQLITLQANHSGQCMVLSASGTLVQSPCAGTPPEQWKIVRSGAFHHLVYGGSNKCLAIVPGTGASTGALGLAACGPAASQAFTLSPTNPGYLVTVGAYCLDVSGGSQAAGTALILDACTQSQSQKWSLASAVAPASWTSVIPLNVDPIAAANLPDGSLLTWAAFNLWTFQGDAQYYPTQTYYSVFNPATLTSGPATVTTATTSDMFCPGTANLSDGRILVNGGSSSPDTTIFSPATGQFAADAYMNSPRGYEGTTPLSNGSVFTLGGSWSGWGTKAGEVWTSGQGWTMLANVPETPVIGPDPVGVFRGDNHLWLFAQSNGVVFQAGSSAQMNWISTSGTGSIVSAGNRADDPYSINGNAVMYDIGKILKAGGAPAYDDGTTTTSAYVIDLNGIAFGSPPAVTKQAPMTYARGFSSGVALPTGQVLISGGQTITNAFTDTGAVLTPEIWDPLTGVFQQLVPMQTPRTYHSIAILLQDGRIFVGGGGQCGYGCSANHFNTEILTPPYLLNADGSAALRTVITSAPAQASVGGVMTVATSTPAASFVLMRNSSITHTTNNDQRRVPMTIFSATPGAKSSTYVLGIPGDGGVTLPGYYMLFAMDPYGVPSVAATVLIQ